MKNQLAWISPASHSYTTLVGSACPSPEPIDRVTAHAWCRPEHPGTRSLDEKSISCIPGIPG